MVNSNLLIKLRGIQCLAAAFVLLIVSLFNRLHERIVQSRFMVAVVALLGVAATVCLIASGPYYFAGPFGLNIKGLFSLGAFLCGVTEALLIMLCAKVFAGTEPYKVLVYSLLSQLLVIAIYSLVICNDMFRPYEGGPPASGIAALAILPGLTALFASMKNTAVSTETASDFVRNKQTQENTSNNNSDNTLFQEQHQHFLALFRIEKADLSAFILFLVTLFFFALAVSVSLGYCASCLNVTTVQIGMRISVDIRLLIVLALIVLLVGKLEQLPLGSICMVVATVISVALSLSPLLAFDSTLTYIIVFSALSVFEIMLWCMFALIDKQKKFKVINVFGFGFAIVMFGNGIGWTFVGNPFPAFVQAGADVPVYVIIALVTLLTASYLFAGKNFSILFSSNAGRELSLSEGKKLKLLVKREEAEEKSRPWKEACMAICQETGLSEREKEIFILLASGYPAETIADDLCISTNTVRTHIHNIYGKLDIHSKQELVNLVRVKTKEF